MANWFVAIPFPAEPWFAARVKDAPAAVRLASADDLHVTVAFLGAVTAPLAHRAWDALRWPTGPLEVALGPVVPMGKASRPSAYSATFARGREPLESAIAACRGALFDAAGARPETRPVKAHVTVARPLDGASEVERADALTWAERLDLGAERVVLRQIALYTWAEERTPARYRVVLAKDLEPARASG